ncbi:MAG: cysteine desulfurase family protein [Armatimonadota bacterium]
MIYLDYAATTPLDPHVDEVMRRYGREIFGNPSSQHAAGRAARAAVDDARDLIADHLGARAAEIIFTCSGTEANNLAIKGVARAQRARGNHIITSAIEHHAVLESCLALEREGFRVTCLPPDAAGIVHPRQVAEAITAETILVAVMYANNEIGAIQPIAEIGAICREHGIPFHTDAVQAAGELGLGVKALNVDLMALSAHKIYGPKGVGALYVRTGTPLQPLLDGGEQEQGRRAGTENVAGIAGFATALSLVPNAEETTRVRTLRDQLIDALLAIPGARLHGDRRQRLANNINIGFDRVSGESLLLALDLAGIAASTGAACAAGAVEPSHVIQALGYPKEQALEAVRLTLGRGTTEEEIRETICTINEIIPRLQR